MPLNFTLQKWDRDSGLPQDTVNTIFQSRDGAIWVGTGEGAARYDGQQFTVIMRRNTRGFPTAAVTAIAESADGTMWFGTDDAGVVHMKDGKPTVYSRTAKLRSSEVHALAADEDGSIWVGTGSGMNRIKDGVVMNLPDDAPVDGGINTFARARDGSLLIGANGLSSMKGEAVEAIALDARQNSRHVRAILEQRSGVRWVVTNAEIIRTEGAETVRFAPNRGIRGSNVNGIAEDFDGNVWLATNEGLLRYVGSRGFALQPVEHLDPNEPVRAVLVDREGSLWIGTTAGLRHLRRTAFTSFGVAEGLRHALTSSICLDVKGVLWVGSAGQGLARIDSKGVTRFGKDQGLISDNIRGLHPLPDGALLVAFDKPGLVYFQDGVATAIPDLDPTIKTGAVTVLRDMHSALWVGNRDGIWRIHEGKAQRFSAAGYDRVNTRQIIEDRQGRVWVAANHGLMRWEDGTMKTFRTEDGLPHTNLRCLLSDTDGVLWIGLSSNGLAWMKDGKFYQCGARQGLPSEAVTALVDDLLGNLWVCTPMGVTRIPKQQLFEYARGERKTVECETFAKADGLRGTEITAIASPAAFRAPDGRLWFAMTKTIATVDPTRIPRNPVPPTVLVTSVVLEGKPVERTGRIVVPPGTSDLDIGYTALSFAQPDKIRYRYRLEGVNRRWVDAGTRRQAAYSQVPPGKRVFRVQAMNNDGVWSETDARVEFEFAPYFYQTWWFYLAMGVAGVLAVWCVHALRMRVVRRREHELITLVEERTAHLQAEIAERKKTQEALTQSEALYESLVQILPLNLYRKDREGRFTFGNDHFCRYVGRAPAELVGRTDADFFPPEVARKLRATDEHVMSTGKSLESEEVEADGQGGRRWFHTLKVPVTNSAGEIVGVQGIAWDITPRKVAEAQAAQAQRELMEVSRVAGMAEVATNVLHNVGNVLNSVNVSVTVAVDRVRASKAAGLARVAQLLDEHAADLAGFMASDPRAKALPGYLKTLSEHLSTDQATLLSELEQLRKNIDHIKGVVAMQQGFARVVGISEEVALEEVVEDALKMNAGALIRHRVEVVRQFDQRPRVVTDRHKVLQILVNLVENAKHACTAAEREDLRIVVAMAEADGKASVRVVDNGVGIAPENLTRIFAHGFTTRKEGHGFGLHSSALIARELGGRIIARSEGLGHGAEFVLELPLRAAEAADGTPAATAAH